jgi:hypothetical protein
MRIHPHAESAHPARTLYKAWSQVLDTGANPGRTSDGLEHRYMTYGHGYYNLIQHGDQISFGSFTVHRSGRFRFNYSLHGHQRRNILMRYVPFLGWGWAFSRYQWYVDFDVDINIYSFRGDKVMRDWENPTHYVSEDLLGARKWGQDRPWCVLEKRDDRWVIQPARNQADLQSHTLKKTAAERRREWERYEALVLKRYAREEAWLTGGMGSPVSQPPPTMRLDNQPLPPDQAVERLAALFSVDAPAKTTPLKRPQEALT